MTLSNAVLARHTDAVFASWAAHGLGAVVALLLVLAVRLRTPDRDEARLGAGPPGRAPLWFYLGGIPGALVVIISAVAVNSELALAGTVALMLTGQVVFGVVSDHLGLLRIPKRRITGMDLAVAGCVLAGSVLIVLGGA
ncbi:EamA-like transporter family protein [Nonomuraea zeae]|uniref:EamA-like transporter family protein n=2 Tax=Nonomuraea zeae TaxID=1642303 RepID=A0A5S4G629_9ACTN|nr:EamA-like transporter family protein [Nonomuraea zeae]